MPLDLFGDDTPITPVQRIRYETRNVDGSWKVNPMGLVHGYTEGQKCKTCKHLCYKEYAKRYYKCSLRGGVDTASPQSDHRVNWPACAKYEPDGEET